MCSHKELPICGRIDIYRVGLVLTEQCNIACSHCWFDSNPRRTGRMSLGQALCYVDQASEIPTIEWISISGGEPFLFPEMLHKIVSAASEKGFHTECVTNCFWAESEDCALETLQSLKEAGLEVINISTDDFHQAHLPFSAVRNCYQAAVRLGLKPVIMCAVGRSSKLTLKKVVRLLGDEDIHILGNGVHPLKPATALAVQSGYLPVGRAVSIPEKELMIGESPLYGHCTSVLRDLSISPAGVVRPCCSAGGLVKGMELGNADRDNIEQIVLDAGRNELLRVLVAEGPEGLRRRYLPLIPEKNYINKCHLCYDMLQQVSKLPESRLPEGI